METCEKPPENVATLVSKLTDNNIEVRINGQTIEVHVNSVKMYETLANREQIIGSINKSLNDILQKHLFTLASKQKASSQEQE